MTSVRFTTWARLEPMTSDPSLRPGIGAEVADPLWLLGRQWQLGEYAAEDVGTPAWLEVHGSLARVGRVALGPPGTAWSPYDPDARPLEAVVEAEPPPGHASGAHLGARAGLRFLRELSDRRVAAATAEAVRAAYPLTVPTGELAPSTRGFLELAARRAPDGLALGRDLRSAMGAGPQRGTALPAALAAVTSTTAFVEACHAYLDWLATVADVRRGQAASQQPAGWRADRLDQTFAISATAPTGNEVVLRAPEYRGGRLDWWAFDVSAETPPATPGPKPKPIRADVLASPLGFPGAPVARYWEFEDSAVDLSAATVAPHETASLLLLEYVFAYGGDSALVPLEAPAGSRLAVQAVVVVDTFGDRVLSERSEITDAAAGRDRFALFTCSGDDAGVLLAPAIGPSFEAEPIEEVALLRDELANLGWAIERVAADAAGASVDHRVMLPPPDPTSPPDLPRAAADDRPPLRWRLLTEPPPSWYPLIPQARGDRLAGFALGSFVAAPNATAPTPRGVLLDELGATGLGEEELPREGRRLTRSPQQARWSDGSLHVWIARRVVPGAGEGSSGVRFDSVLPGS